MDNQDDAKEAQERLHGKVGVDPEAKLSKTARLIAKGLKRFDGIDVELEEDNPYFSDVDDDELDDIAKDDDKEQQRIMDLLKKDMKPKKTPPSQAIPVSPQIKRDGSPFANEEPLSKRIKVVYTLISRAKSPLHLQQPK
jgi:hypothetical protein